MLVPVGQPISVPVEVICIGAPPLRVLRGHLRRYDRRTYDVELEDAGTEVPAGTRVVLNLRAAGGHRVRGVVSVSRRGRLQVHEQDVSPPEKRSFPRLLGAIPLRWCPAPSPVDHAAVARWLAGGAAPVPPDAWSEPDPLMNFSVTGLRFDDGRPATVGATVLLELGVADEPRRWRATGRVVRAERPVSPADPEAPWTIAIEFVELPAGAREALTAYTLRRQQHLA